MTHKRKLGKMTPQELRDVVTPSLFDCLEFSFSWVLSSLALLPALKLSSFSVAVHKLPPALASPLSPITRIFHLFSMLRWVSTTELLLFLLPHPPPLSPKYTHINTHIFQRGSVTQMDDRLHAVQEAVASLWRPMGLFHPGRRWLYLLCCASKSLGSSLHRHCCFQWFVMCLLCN